MKRSTFTIVLVFLSMSVAGCIIVGDVFFKLQLASVATFIVLIGSAMVVAYA